MTDKNKLHFWVMVYGALAFVFGVALAPFILKAFWVYLVSALILLSFNNWWIGRKLTKLS